MTILFVLALIGGMVYLVSRLKPGTPEDDFAYDDEEAPPARLGVRGVPDGWVAVRSSVKAPEAAVLQALLDANGVRSTLDTMDPMGRAVMSYPAHDRWLRLCVAPEDAEYASSLIEEQRR